MSDLDPTTVAGDPQLGKDVYVHTVEFRPDGTIDITLSDRKQASDKALITKLVSIHPDLISKDELADVIDTIVDWTDEAWRYIRES